MDTPGQDDVDESDAGASTASTPEAPAPLSSSTPSTTAPVSPNASVGPPPNASTAATVGDATAASPLGLSGGDWPTQATDTIVDLIGTVREKTTGPVTTVARGIVFGVFLAVVATVVTVMALIALVRLLDEILPSGVWLPYLILGLVFTGVGALVFRKRRPQGAA